MNMLISLIVPTLNRPHELELFIKSLLTQSYQNYELIVVDQNQDDRVTDILDKYQNQIPFVRHVKIAQKGASVARNRGLMEVRGEIVGFPDDDCEYEFGVLEKVVASFAEDVELGGLTGGHVTSFHPPPSYKPQRILLNRYNVWFHSIGFTIFLRKSVIASIGKFDERVGTAATPVPLFKDQATFMLSGEDTDYLIRAIQAHHKLIYDNSIVIKHPKASFDQPNIHLKAFYYSIGRRFILNKHHYPYWFVLLNLIYPLCRMVRYGYHFKKVRYFAYQFLGRCHFWQKYFSWDELHFRGNDLFV